MNRYSRQTRLLAAVDCIIFGFDGTEMKILLVQRGLEPEQGRWSLMGGFLQPDETLEEAAARELQRLTGLDKIFLEQLQVFSHPTRDPIERTISVAFFALLDLAKYKQQLSPDFHADWFPLTKHPKLIFDHNQMVAMALAELRYRASLHPVLFELLPDRFTIPQLQALFEAVYGTAFDKRNFSRKMASTGLLVKLDVKDKASSKKGAFYYKLNKKHYRQVFQSILRFIPNPNGLL